MATTAKENEKTAEDIGNLKFVYEDCKVETKSKLQSIAIKALQCYQRGEILQFTEIAQMIKNEITMEGAWHVIVGKSFGSFVSHETKQYVNIDICC